MKVIYGLKIYGFWKTQWWNDKENNGKTMAHHETTFYDELDDLLFNDILRDELDVVNYQITADNIKKEFGFTVNNRQISDECIVRIIKYYKFRKHLYEKIRDNFLNCKAEKMIESSGSDVITFKYKIPAEYNNFSCEDSGYTGGQHDAWIEILLKSEN
jgi:hypothetical protein